MGYNLLDIIYPPHCYLCQDSLEKHRYICPSCLNSFDQITDPICEKCGGLANKSGGLCAECAEGDRNFFLSRSFGLYKSGGSLARSIGGLKYEGERALAKDLASLFEKGKTAELLNRAEAVTYVPLSEKKLAQRGFNQAKLLARAVARRRELPLLQTLVKTKITRPQAELGKEERKSNIRGSFDYREDIDRESVLLIDDVFTTGTTADECSKVLKVAGAKRVYVATLARSYLG